MLKVFNRSAFLRGKLVVMPCPFEAARTIGFDFSQWFARIIFSCYFFYPFDTMFEDLILPANVPPVISSTLFQVSLLY